MQIATKYSLTKGIFIKDTFYDQVVDNRYFSKKPLRVNR